MSKQYNCKNVGCRETFSWPMQVARHAAKCQYPVPVVQKKYHLVDGKYRCSKCSKGFSHQASATRHSKIDCLKQKKEYKCTVCSKVFLYKSKQKKHQKFHVKSAAQQCQHCNKSFRRKDIFLKHVESCVSSVNDTFIPSFLSPIDNIEVEMDLFRPLEAQEMLDQETENDILIEPQTNSEITYDNHDLDTLNSEFSNFNVLENSTEAPSESIDTEPCITARNKYWREYRDVKRKSQNLEDIIQSLSSPVKLNVCRNVFKVVNDFDKVVCEGLMKYLYQLWNAKKYPEFYNLLVEVCSEQLIDEPDFVSWLSSKLDIRCYRLKEYLKKAKENNFEENRGRSALSKMTKQKIYDMWIQNSINSTDGRNGRNQVSMNKESYIKKYGTDLVNEEVAKFFKDEKMNT